MKLNIFGFLKICFRKSISLKLFFHSLLYKVNKSAIHVIDTFPSFAPASPGSYKIKSKLTILSINQIIPALNLFVDTKDKNYLFRSELEKKLFISTPFKKYLGELFSKYGSDKSKAHNYHFVYGEILKESKSIKKIFEIGLGTNNRDVFSSMGRKGRPGASLRAFRDAYKSAQIIGVDYDKRILFSEERIKSFFVDQTDFNTFNQISDEIGDNFDLMIDDGLHSPNANLHSLKFFIKRLKIGGYAVIEDISIHSKGIWDITTALLPSNFNGALIKTKSAYIYLVKRIS